MSNKQLAICNNIKTQSSVSAAKTTKDTQHTSVLFTGTVKLPNSAFCISKTTKPISTNLYIFCLTCTILHIYIKIEETCFSIYQDTHS